MSKTPVRIDIVSDIVCPWCLIGYKRLEKALEEIDDKIEEEIYWHPFELNPQMPQGGENLRAHLAAKYGTTLEGSIKARANLTKIGAGLNFKFDYFDEMKMFNTFKAHQLLHYARKFNKEHDLIIRLFTAFFGERKEVDQIDVLVQEATKVGLEESESYLILEDQRYEKAVRIEEKKWLEQGIQGVPTFVINNREMISGAQESDTLANLILRSVR